jgi:hypothetical protein
MILVADMRTPFIGLAAQSCGRLMDRSKLGLAFAFAFADSRHLKLEA